MADISAKKVKDGAREAATQARPWAGRLIRFGYISRGTVYLTLALLALRMALGQGGDSPSSNDVLQTLFQQPLGAFLVALLGAGLFGYAFWRLIQGLFDPENLCEGLPGAVERVGHVVSALIHGALGVSAIRLIIGLRLSDDDQAPKDWTAWAFSQPYGPWLVAIAGAIVAGIGIAQLYTALSGRFLRDIKFIEMDRNKERWVIRISRFGLIARGVVFGVISALLFQAALQFNPERAEGMGGALNTLATQPYGPWLLGGVAAGLGAYGLHNLIYARYRRLPAEVDSKR